MEVCVERRLNMEKSKRVETYEVRLYCDECGEEMKEVEPSMVLTTFPPQYAYHCVNSKCSAKGKKVLSARPYPYIHYEAEEYL